MIIIGLLFSIAVFLWYTLTVYSRYGVTSSISSSYLYFPEGTERAYYTLFIWGIAFPMMFMSDCTLGFWAGAALCIDGAAPLPVVKDKLRMFLHCAGADVGMVLGMAMLGFVFHLWLLVILTGIFIAYAYLKGIKNSVWWIETAVFVAVTIGLFIAKVL
jgi:hypothetical protein